MYGCPAKELTTVGMRITTLDWFWFVAEGRPTPLVASGGSVSNDSISLMARSMSTRVV